jgi:hypothetical protein
MRFRGRQLGSEQVMRACRGVAAVSIASYAVFAVPSAVPAQQPDAAQIPLTAEAFKTLDPQQAARRLLGSSGAAFTEMKIGYPMAPPDLALDAVMFLSKPQLAAQGLCKRNVVTVRLEPETAQASRARASTPMKPVAIYGEFNYFIVGDLGATNDANLDETAKLCSAAERPPEAFSASNDVLAWQAAWLFEAALKERRARDPQARDLKCKTSQCGDLNKAFDQLSSRFIWSAAPTCMAPEVSGRRCFAFSVSDLTSGYRAWYVNVEGKVGREMTFEKADFTLMSQPVI